MQRLLGAIWITVCLALALPAVFKHEEEREESRRASVVWHAR